jgi:hypothetical protein
MNSYFQDGFNKKQIVTIKSVGCAPSGTPCRYLGAADHFCVTYQEFKQAAKEPIARRSVQKSLNLLK